MAHFLTHQQNQLHGGTCFYGSIVHMALYACSGVGLLPHFKAAFSVGISCFDHIRVLLEDNSGFFRVIIMFSTLFTVIKLLELLVQVITVL